MTAAFKSILYSATIAASLIFIVACQRNDSSSGNELAVGGAPIKNESATRVVRLCNEKTIDRKMTVDASQLVLGESSEDPLCIDDTDQITYEQKYAKLRLYKDGGAAVELKCSDKRAHASFFARNRGASVALLAGNRAVAIFSIVDPVPQATCGQIDVSAFEQATELCEAFATQWGSSGDDCFELCDGDTEVCIQPPA